MYQMVFKNGSLWSYHLPIILSGSSTLSSLQTDCPYLPFGATTVQVKLHGLLHPGWFDNLLRRFRLQLHRLSDLEAMIPSSQHPTERIPKRIRQRGKTLQYYVSPGLLKCSSIWGMRFFLKRALVKFTPSREVLARYPDPPRAAEMDSSATHAPQASASPMAGNTCCTHSQWVCLEARRSSNPRAVSTMLHMICSSTYFLATSHYIVLRLHSKLFLSSSARVTLANWILNLPMFVRQKGLDLCQAAGPSPDQTAQGWPWHPNKLAATARRTGDTGSQFSSRSWLTYNSYAFTYKLHILQHACIQIMMENDFRLLLPSHFQKDPKGRKQDSWNCTISTWKHVLKLVMGMTGISDLSWASLIPGTASIISCKVPSQKIFCWVYIPRCKQSKASRVNGVKQLESITPLTTDMSFVYSVSVMSVHRMHSPLG